MFLHVGNGKSIRKNKIIGIFDLDNATVSVITKNYINKMQKDGLLEYDDEDLPRSFIVYEDGKTKKVALSRISTSGLRLRADEKLTELNND